MLRFLSVTQNVAKIWNLGIFTSVNLALVHKNDGYHSCQKLILTPLHGNNHKCVNLDVGTRNEAVTYISRCYIISEQPRGSEILL